MYHPYQIRLKIHPGQIADIFLLLMIIFCFYLSYNHPIDVGDNLQNWSFAHIILHSLPLYFYLKNLNWQKVNFPFIETLGIFNILHYGLPVFFIKIFDFQLGTLSVKALEESFYAYSIFYITYYIFRGQLKIKPIEFIPAQTSPQRLKFYAYTLVAVYFINRFISDSTLQHIGNVGIYGRIIR